MNVKCRVIYFVSLIMFISIICCCCSKEKEEPVDNKKEDIGIESDKKDADIKLVDDDLPEEDETKDLPEEVETEDLTDEVENDDASPWTLLSDSTVNTKVDYAGFINEAIGITVGYAGAISYTADGGKSWSESSNVSACRYGLDLYDEGFFVSSGNSGVNLVSNDKGKTWSGLADFPLKENEIYNKFISVIDKNNMYVGSKLSLGVTDDGGASWRELKVPDECTNIAGMFFMTPEIGYLLNIDGTLYITKDSCDSWTVETLDLGGEKIADSKMPSVAINFQDNEQGMIVYATESYKVLCMRTQDGGSTWEYISMPEVYCRAPYLSRDGRLLTLSSSIKRVCLYKLETE